MSVNPLDLTSKILLKYFWDWTPDTWATLSFTSSGRRRTIVRESEDPFIAVICVSAGIPDRALAGTVAGFYMVSHIEGHRNEFTDTVHHDRYPQSWQHGLKVHRAFTFLPEYRTKTYDLHPGIRDHVRAVGAYGEWLDTDKIERLRRIPFVEVPVFGGPSFLTGDVYVPVASPARHAVRAGPVNRTGYAVPGEPPDTEKELYVLELTGDATTYLEEFEGDLRIFKVGLSISPSMRLETFRKAMPRGTFKWELFRSTRLDGHTPYPSVEAAETGERAMKEHLGGRGIARWLGGEFYAATESEIAAAWVIGRNSALAYRG